MENLKFKNFEIQETKADGKGNLHIIGYGAYFDNIDSYGDIMVPGSCKRTIETRLKKDGSSRIAFCYQHDMWNPIGRIDTILEDDKGLFVDVMLSAAEQDIQTKVKERILSELSIGYRTIDSRSETRNGKNVNILTDVEIIEISLVTVAANPLAVIEKMKSEEKYDYISKEFDRVLAIVRNVNINFEIQKLKSLVLSVTPEPQQPKEQTLISKDELITALIGSKKELLTALNGNKN